MRADALDPHRIDTGRRPREQPRGLDQLGRHHPAAALLCQRRTGPDEEADPARAAVGGLAIVGIERLEAHVAEQPGQQRGVQLLEGRRAGIDPPAEFGDLLRQLAVHVAPLAHAARRDEVRLQVVGQLAVGLLVLDALADERPQLQQRLEVAALVGELFVRLIGRLLRLERPLARVLHAERGGNHQHLGKRLLVARGQQHAADARIERQARQLAPDRRQRALRIDRVEFGQQVIAVSNGPTRRRLHKRKRAHIAQAERLHAQDHAGQRRSQDLRIGEARPLDEVGLVVQPDADAGGHAATAAGALVGGGLRDRLDLQLLDLVAVAVALDAGHPGIDHIADAGHRQRGLCDVGGQHDAPQSTAPGLEHAVLLLRRQARKQRQDFGAGRVMLAQRLGRLPDFALAGQEYQHIAAAGARAFVDRIDDRLHQRAVIGIVGIGDRPPAHLHRVGAPGDRDHRRWVLAAAEVLREALGIDGGRGDDELEVGPLRQQLLQVAEQEVDVQ